MNYEVVKLPARRVVGIAARTANSAADCAAVIGKLWQDFMGEGGAYEKLAPPAPTAPVYGLYTNYNWQEMSYDVLAACESSTCPKGFREVVIPAGKYAKFTFKGDVRESTAKAWDEVWNTPLPRAYGVDFEVYHAMDETMQGEISIYVGLADLCQSCGMPMADKSLYGTNADGTQSTDYCRYCYENGAFTSDCTMEGMIDLCLSLPESASLYTDKEAARQQMLEYFPTLKRWKK